MRNPVPIALALLALSTAAVSQSTLTTTFADNNGGSANWLNCFDLQVNVPIVISQLDINASGGTTGTVDFYTFPTTFVGNTTNGGTGWTLQGSATVTLANPRGTPTPATFSTPFVLPPGNYGVALHYQGVGMAYTNGTGSNQTYSTPELTLTAGESVPGFFTGSPFTPRVWNGTIYYSPSSGGNFALSQPYGSGCPDNAASLYETFAGGAFDLGGTSTSEQSISFLNTGLGYIAVPGSRSWVTPSATLNVGATASVTATLPTPFPVPGGTPTTTISVCSEGYVWLGTNTTADTTPTAAELLNGALPRFAPLWNSMTPGAGSVFFDVDSATGLSTVTFLNVPSAAGGTNSFQLQLEPTGVAHFVYRDIGASGAVVTGYSPGNMARNSGSVDLSTQLPIVLDPDEYPLTIRSNRPVEGQTLTVTVTEVPANSGFGALILSGTQFINGSPSPISGMTGCALFVGLDDVAYFVPTAGTSTITFPQALPTGFSGTSIYMQAAVFAPGSNPAGIIASNGLDLLLNPN